MKKIYFIKPVGMAGPIKIGCSKWPEHRLVEIGRWSPIDLEIMARGAGSHELERFIHRMFADQRSHKEWFHSTPELVNRINLVKAGADVAAAFGAVAYYRKGQSWPSIPKFRAASAESEAA